MCVLCRDRRAHSRKIKGLTSVLTILIFHVQPLLRDPQGPALLLWQFGSWWCDCPSKAFTYAEYLASDQRKTLWGWSSSGCALPPPSRPHTRTFISSCTRWPWTEDPLRDAFHPNQDEKTPRFSSPHNARIYVTCSSEPWTECIFTWKSTSLPQIPGGLGIFSSFWIPIFDCPPLLTEEQSKFTTLPSSPLPLSPASLIKALWL